MAMLATSGYGYEVLNPHSDIDIMFYPDWISNRERFATFQKVLTEEILYPLGSGWKSVMLHATREVLEKQRNQSKTPH